MAPVDDKLSKVGERRKLQAICRRANGKMGTDTAKRD
jgi:hypothetical protein